MIDGSSQSQSTQEKKKKSEEGDAATPSGWFLR
jgi:hypothetical protein